MLLTNREKYWARLFAKHEKALKILILSIPVIWLVTLIILTILEYVNIYTLDITNRNYYLILPMVFTLFVVLGFVMICLECRNRISKLPEQVIKQAKEKFLSGNKTMLIIGPMINETRQEDDAEELYNWLKQYTLLKEKREGFSKLPQEIADLESQLKLA